MAAPKRFDTETRFKLDSGMKKALVAAAQAESLTESDLIRRAIKRELALRVNNSIARIEEVN